MRRAKSFGPADRRGNKRSEAIQRTSASLPFKCSPAPLGATHDTNATRLATSTTAPPCPPPTRCAGGPTRTVACEAGYFFSGRRRRVVVGGAFGYKQNQTRNRRQSTQHRCLRCANRAPALGFPESLLNYAAIKTQKNQKKILTTQPKDRRPPKVLPLWGFCA